MASRFTITRPAGRASFESVIRSWDESPQNALSVAGHLVLYGIWRPKWAPNDHDFNVEIASFGWADKYNAGNPNPMTRRRLSAERAAEVKALIIALVEDVDARKKILPFSSKTAHFLGCTEFKGDWVLPAD